MGAAAMMPSERKRQHRLYVLQWKVIFTACAFRDGQVGRLAFEAAIDDCRRAVIEQEKGKLIQ